VVGVVAPLDSVVIVDSSVRWDGRRTAAR